MESICTIFRPSSVSRDSAQGTLQNFTVLVPAIPCSQQQAGTMKQLLYYQQDTTVNATIYFSDNPGATANDYLLATDDYTGVTNFYLVQGRAQAIARGEVWTLECQLIQAPAAPATVVLPSVGTLTSSSAVLGGNVTDAGGVNLTEVGVVISQTAVNNYPRLGGTGVDVLDSATVTGPFTVNASGLVAGTIYSFAPFATNGVATTYGCCTEFTTL